jgi:predicted permease
MLRVILQALRGLARSPGHSIVVVLALSLGIGATTSIYGVVNGVLAKPLPFPDPERLIMLWQRAPGVGVAEDWLSPAQYFDLRDGVRSFEEIAFVFGKNVTLTGDDAEPERLGALEVSSSFFALLGIEPVLGRSLGKGDDVPGSAPKVLLSRRLYETRFRADPEVVGRTIEVDGVRLEVVGVLPPLPLDADLLPTLATVPVFDLVLSLPLEDPQRTTHGSENYNVLARIAPSATLAEVETELLAVASRIVKDPESLGAGLAPGSEYRIDAVSLLDQVVGPVRTPLVLLLAATGVLLLIACANVANLVLTRAASRRRELALLVAMGASRPRLLAHSLVPNLALAAAAGVVGVGFAAAGVFWLRRAAPPDLPRLGEIAVDFRVLLFAAAVSLAASLLFGLVPALRVSSISPAEALRSLHGGISGVRAGLLFRGGVRYLVVVQVALALVLVTAAGLLLRTFEGLRSVPPGFRPEGALTFRLSLVGERYEDPGSRNRFFDLLFERLRSVPGAVDAGGISMLPLTRGYAWTDFLLEDQEVSDERERVVADVHIVTDGYFEAMGIPVLAGRSFTRADDNDPPVVLVNRALAERFWSLEEAVGKWVARKPDDRATILGVVEDVKHYGLASEPRMTVFYPYERSSSRTLFGVIRRERDAALTPHVVEAVRELDPQIPVYDVELMSDRVRLSLLRQETLMILLLLLSGIALTLATVGLYGILSFAVATHTREIGIRKAVGANARDLYWLVLRGAGAVIAIGVALGVVAAIFAGRLLEGLLFGVGARDPLSLSASALIVTAVGISASFLASRRAAAVDPIVALQED